MKTSTFFLQAILATVMAAPVVSETDTTSSGVTVKSDGTVVLRRADTGSGKLVERAVGNVDDEPENSNSYYTDQQAEFPDFYPNLYQGGSYQGATQGYSGSATVLGPEYAQPESNPSAVFPPRQSQIPGNNPPQSQSTFSGSPFNSGYGAPYPYSFPNVPGGAPVGVHSANAAGSVATPTSISGSYPYGTGGYSPGQFGSLDPGAFGPGSFGSYSPYEYSPNQHEPRPQRYPTYLPKYQQYPQYEYPHEYPQYEYPPPQYEQYTGQHEYRPYEYSQPSSQYSYSDESADAWGNIGCYSRSTNAVAAESGSCLRYLLCPWSWFGDRCDNGQSICPGGYCGGGSDGEQGSSYQPCYQPQEQCYQAPLPRASEPSPLQTPNYVPYQAPHTPRYVSQPPPVVRPPVPVQCASQPSSRQNFHPAGPAPYIPQPESCGTQPQYESSGCCGGYCGGNGFSKDCYSKVGNGAAAESGRCIRWLVCPWSWFGDRFDNGAHASCHNSNGCCGSQ